jgi:hypothetical protein
MTKVGDKVRVTPDPAFFNDPSDYRYVMRPDSSVVGHDLTVAAVFPADEPHPGLYSLRVMDDLERTQVRKRVILGFLGLAAAVWYILLLQTRTSVRSE